MVTFQKRQREMKKLEKQRIKAERRALRKLGKAEEPQVSEQNEIAFAGPEPQERD
jgi:hypothetical protein